MEFDALIHVGRLSVWVGNLNTHREFEHYLVAQFESDYGFKIDPEGKIEGKVEVADIAIGLLVAGFSRSKTFATKCIQAAEAKQKHSASCMLIIYDLKYEDNMIQNPSAPLTFLGAFEYQGFN